MDPGDDGAVQLVNALKSATDIPARDAAIHALEQQDRKTAIMAVGRELGSAPSPTEKENLYVGYLELLGPGKMSTYEGMELRDMTTVFQQLIALDIPLPRYRHYQNYTETILEFYRSCRAVSTLFDYGTDYESTDYRRLCSICKDMYFERSIDDPFNAILSSVNIDGVPKLTDLIAFRYIWSFVEFTNMSEIQAQQFNSKFQGIDKVISIINKLLPQKDTIQVEFGLETLTFFMSIAIPASPYEAEDLTVLYLAAGCIPEIIKLFERLNGEMGVLVPVLLRFLSLLPRNDGTSVERLTTQNQVMTLLPLFLRYGDRPEVISFLRMRKDVPSLYSLLPHLAFCEDYMTLLKLCKDAGVFEDHKGIEALFQREVVGFNKESAYLALKFVTDNGYVNQETISVLTNALLGLWMTDSWDREATVEILSHWTEYKEQVMEELEQSAVRLHYVEHLADRIIELFGVIDSFLGEFRHPAVDFISLFASITSYPTLTKGMRHLVFLFSGADHYQAVDNVLCVQDFLPFLADGQEAELKRYCSERASQDPRYYVVLSGLPGCNFGRGGAIDKTEKIPELCAAVFRNYSKSDVDAALKALLVIGKNAVSKPGTFAMLLGGRAHASNDRLAVICKVFGELSKCGWIHEHVEEFGRTFVECCGPVLDCDQESIDLFNKAASAVCRNLPQIPFPFAKFITSCAKFPRCTVNILRKCTDKEAITELALTVFMQALGEEKDYPNDMAGNVIAALPKGEETVGSIVRVMLTSQFRRKENIERFASAAIAHAGSPA